MMMQVYLIASADGLAAFDGLRLRSAIEALPNVIFVDEEPTSRVSFLKASLTPQVDTTWPIPITVSDDLRIVTIGAFDQNGLAAALDIHRLYGSEIYAFSEQSSPHIILLSAVQSTSDLADRLKLSE